MRLIKIGHDQHCDIIMPSQKVSALHAELTLLDSGDMLLEDKNSTNGTYVMNQRIQPGQPVKVRRGDAIRFGDTELQWGQIPMPEDNSAYRAIFGVGSHTSNDIQISGSTVSRYHATIKQGRDGKMYIVDHSRNGTTVNGQKISSHMPVRIKRNSVIVCGGVPVDTSNLPWPSQAWKTMLAVAAVFAVVLVVGLNIPKIKPYIWPSPVDTVVTKPTVTLEALENATACIMHTYYIEAVIDDDPFVGLIPTWPEKWKFGVDQSGNISLASFHTGVSPITGRGTAFFISPNGEMGTNRHIAEPWSYIDAEVKDYIKQTMQKELTEGSAIYKYLIRILVSNIARMRMSEDDAILRLQRLNKSAITITGETEYMGVILAGRNYITVADLLSCQTIATTGNERQDVALLRLNEPQTPQSILNEGYFDIENARVDEQTLRPLQDELTIIGYPAQYGIANSPIAKGTEIRPTLHKTAISKRPDNDMFEIQANVVGGQSGSPVVDAEMRLIGVVSSSYRRTDVAFGCNIKHLKELYDKHKIRK